eukprot:1159950-Pelagomonas_calceolata.AAC.7
MALVHDRQVKGPACDVQKHKRFSTWAKQVSGSMNARAAHVIFWVDLIKSRAASGMCHQCPHRCRAASSMCTMLSRPSCI